MYPVRNFQEHICNFKQETYARAVCVFGLQLQDSNPFTVSSSDGSN